jgi:exoribonuclease II
MARHIMYCVQVYWTGHRVRLVPVQIACTHSRQRLHFPHTGQFIDRSLQWEPEPKPITRFAQRLHQLAYRHLQRHF